MYEINIYLQKVKMNIRTDVRVKLLDKYSIYKYKEEEKLCCEGKEANLSSFYHKAPTSCNFHEIR